MRYDVTGSDSVRGNYPDEPGEVMGVVGRASWSAASLPASCGAVPAWPPESPWNTLCRREILDKAIVQPPLQSFQKLY